MGPSPQAPQAPPQPYLPTQPPRARIGARSGPSFGGPATAILVVLLAIGGYLVYNRYDKPSIKLPPEPTATIVNTQPDPLAGANQSTLAQALTQIAVQPSEIAPGFTIRLIRDGDQVAGQVTMDNCGFDFTTEADRIARHQVVVVDSHGPGGVSNEVVAYDSPQDAALAAAQWYRSAAHCPPTPQLGSIAGEGMVLTKVAENLRSASFLPNPINVLTIESQSQGKITAWAIDILQVHYSVLDAIWIEQLARPNAQDIAKAITLARSTGNRLAALG